MTLHYPASFSGIEAWCAANDINLREGRDRFAQYAVLRAITSSRVLSNMLVFKGGNALDFIWRPNRSTRDLDFSVDMAVIEANWEPTTFQSLLRISLEQSLKVATDQLGVVFTLHNVKKQPPGLNRTFVTFTVSIGYALPDQVVLIRRMQASKLSTDVVLVEISLNEPICADETIDIQATNRLRVSTVEDIVAEKLRALLQQPIRNRNRRQDVLDIAVLLKQGTSLDRARIAEFLLRKSAARNIAVSRSAFHNPEIARRAEVDYIALSETTRRLFIPFDDALRSLLDFVDTLPIPSNSSEDHGSRVTEG